MDSAGAVRAGGGGGGGVAAASSSGSSDDVVNNDDDSPRASGRRTRATTSATMEAAAAATTSTTTTNISNHMSSSAIARTNVNKPLKRPAPTTPAAAAKQQQQQQQQQMDMEAVGRYIESNGPQFLAWLRDKASPEIRRRLETSLMADKKPDREEAARRQNEKDEEEEDEGAVSAGGVSAGGGGGEEACSTAAAATSSTVSQRNKRNSITSDLFQAWLASNSPIKRARSPSRSSGGEGGQQQQQQLPLTQRRRELRRMTENELLMELIRDVANELDINALCHKILVNVGILTRADRASLFLARGSSDDRYLVAKLFDVRQDTEFEDAVAEAQHREEIRVPFGVGIVGCVAQNKQIINIKDAYTDPRFNPEIDQRTGYRTKFILAVPIRNYEGDVIGVAQIINKIEDDDDDGDGIKQKKKEEDDEEAEEGFSEHDVKLFERYLTFCGIGIQNAQLFELSILEYRRNQILLNLARSIFEEQNNLECLVTKIMTEAKDLLKCERCAVYLLDLDCGEAGHLEKIVQRPSKSIQESRRPLLRRESNNIDMDDILRQHAGEESQFTMVFELEHGEQNAKTYRPTSEQLKSPLGQIARYVAATGQILNIGDVASWSSGKHVFQSSSGASSTPTRSILCMPIVNGQRAIIGVAQTINKDTAAGCCSASCGSSAFADSDVTIFEAFAIFCGLGIHNTQMYESACKLMAKQKVALECLSYHATAANDDAVKLAMDPIKPAEQYNLYSFNFIDFDLSDEDTCRACLRMFQTCDLIDRFHIPYDVLCRWILSVKKNYRPVKYHNWRHALNVAQTMFAMLKTGKMEQFMTDIEILGLLVACLCHDLDHRGTNNAFQMKTESPLAILYSTSTMEHHHFDQCVMILSSDSNNIFQNLAMEDYRRVMRVVESAILSTDLAGYFKKKIVFTQLIDEGEFDWQSAEKKELLCGMMMTACDVSAIAKPWEIQHRVAKLVADEFFDQGDLERLQLNQQPVAMMDRERRDELPQMQVGFIDVICLPLYRVLADTFPWIEPLYQGTAENRRHWQDLAEKVEMGLTWIDRDTIEEPVEEFVSQEPRDIEFTVTTLNCQQHVNKQEATSTAGGSTGGKSSSSAASSALGKFASLRKGGQRLGKGMRQRFNRSLHSRSNSEPDNSNLGAAAAAAANSNNSLQSGGNVESAAGTGGPGPSATAAAAATTEATTTTTTSRGSSAGSGKKNKLCQLI
ncbi:cGMP-specific 3',5'-cyclic phosphodiesterase [Trichogramma pretiosum]|uniref:cGMP-specific 3',5'-cyclic phosphodiesterase n=1 Tax=Trichogramma pretiosum TaxID=7493 RepID=UPI0006C9C44C|nr:cGMP-specific 3',5'-cyclic phosphodiesterase [Trichogramma pretiosum]XP_014220156.1 cGMP-specific 3',5'-cyclic phosphodiesterase [Trichogramma pretiosum]